MAVSQALVEKSKSIEGVEQYPYRAVAAALEVSQEENNSIQDNRS
jgi:hypothetical protein